MGVATSRPKVARRAMQLVSISVVSSGCESALKGMTSSRRVLISSGPLPKVRRLIDHPETSWAFSSVRCGHP